MKAEFEERQKSNPMNALLGGGGSGQPAATNFDMAAFLAGSGGSSKGGNGNGGGNKNQGARR